MIYLLDTNVCVSYLPTDTPDTLDYDRMARATLGVAGGVARLAGSRWRPEKPPH
jgi:hypothetical protein